MFDVKRRSRDVLSAQLRGQPGIKTFLDEMQNAGGKKCRR